MDGLLLHRLNLQSIQLLIKDLQNRQEVIIVVHRPSQQHVKEL